MTPLLLAVPLLLAAPVPKELKAAKADAEAILGTWEIVACVRNGRPDAGTVGLKYRFAAGGTCTILHKGGNRTSELKCLLDPTAAPKRFLWDATWGTWNGVYELKGDDLKMVFPDQAKAPPPAEVGPGPAVNYSVLKRVKE